MDDIHNPDNPIYDKESELTREIIFEKLTDEEICFLEEEDEYNVREIFRYSKRILNIKSEITKLIEVLEQTEQTYTLNKLKEIVNL